MEKILKIDLVAAARPNFMKIAPLWHALSKEKWAKVRIIHTGQHYDHTMSTVFFEELGLPSPHINLEIGSGTHGQQTGRVLEAYENLLLTQEKPDLVIVVGDVNATPAATMAAVKLGIRVAHLEAGLRSFDRSMPEEINRLVTDSICDELWTPSPDADENLLKEGIAPTRIKRVGNIMIDTLEYLRPHIEASPVLHEVNLTGRKYALLTLHRPSNVDTKESLSRIFNSLEQCAGKMPFVFPVHPRTKARMEEFGFLKTIQRDSRFILLPPQPYCAFMQLVFNAHAVVTDSGGVQEETSYLGIPCFTLRENTERPVTITCGSNQLTPIETLIKVFSQIKPRRKKDIDLWDGNTSSRILAHLKNSLIRT